MSEAAVTNAMPWHRSSHHNLRSGETAGSGLLQHASMPAPAGLPGPPLLLAGLAAVSCMSSSTAAALATVPGAATAAAPSLQSPDCGRGSGSDQYTSSPLASCCPVWTSAAVAAAAASSACAARADQLGPMSLRDRRRCFAEGFRSVGKAALMSAACRQGKQEGEQANKQHGWARESTLPVRPVQLNPAGSMNGWLAPFAESGRQPEH